MFRRRHNRIMQRGGRLAVVVAILLTAVCPIPIARVSPDELGKDRSVAFPCMDRPCGCQSAEQCWKSCCCFTNEQKVVWAEETGAEIPAHVVTAARKEAAGESLTVVEVSEPESPESCGSKCCSTKMASCCSDAADEICCAPSEGPDEPAESCCDRSTKSKTRVKWISWNAVARCQGQTAGLWSIGAVVIPSPPMLSHPQTLPTETLVVESEMLARGSKSPPDPPPRIG